MPALGKGGPRPGCLRGAFSSARTGWLGRESGCGGGTRGGARKFCPRGWREHESPPLAQGLSAVDGFSPLLAPTSYCGCLVGKRAQAPSSWCGRSGVGSSGPGGRGRGCPVLAAVASWPPPRSGWCVEARTGLPLPLPWGPPTSCVLSPPGTLGRGLEGCATRCPGPILLKPLLPWRAGGGGGSREELLPSAGSAVRLLAAGFARRREPQRPPLPGRPRAEERSARTQAPAAPWPGRRPGRRGWRRSRWLQGARAAPRPGSHPFPLVLARNVGL